jgi:hypothetical protein
VTELIGSGKADLGTKAMIHTIAGKARGFPIKSIGTLMDEPFTGVLYLEVRGMRMRPPMNARRSLTMPMSPFLRDPASPLTSRASRASESVTLESLER